jgi:hypothetical protein
MELMNPSRELFNPDDWDRRRVANLALNFILGAGGAHGMRTGKILEGAGMIGLAPAKDLLLNAQELPARIEDTLDRVNTAMDAAPSVTDEWKNLAKNLSIGAGVVGAGALGLGALKLMQDASKNEEAEKSVGTIKYRIPGKKGDPDTATLVELPLDSNVLSPTMVDNINTNIRRQAQKNIRANMRKRDPYTGKLIPLPEWEARYGKPELMEIKSASAAELEEGLTAGKAPRPAYEVYEEETPSTTQAFYRLRAGMGFNDNIGTTVKVASRSFHEGAGSMLTGLTSAAAGGALGNLIAKNLPAGMHVNPLLGTIGGAILGGITPAMLGKLLAAVQEEDRSAAAQASHDKELPAAEYLIPGYGNYQASRRDSAGGSKDMQITGASFAATGMNPIAPTQQDMNLQEAMLADEDMEYDVLSKYAGAAPPPPPGGGQGGGAPQGGAQVDPSKSSTDTGIGSRVKGTFDNMLARIQNGLNSYKMKTQQMAQGGAQPAPPADGSAPAGPPPPPQG